MPDSDFWAKVADDRDDPVATLLRSHAELREALILAGKEIVRLNFGKRNTPLLKKLRATLREACAVAKRFEKK